MTDQPVTLSNTLTVAGRAAVGGVVYAGTSLALRASITASAGVANGLFNFTTLVAAANSDALTASRIDPTFTPGSFTGLTARGLQISAFSNATFTTPGDIIGIDIGVVTGAGTNAYGLKVGTPTGATNNYSIYTSGIVAIASASANALTVGRLGTTTPALKVDASAATSITGVSITSGASGAGVAIAAIGETNVSVTLNGAGSGTVAVGGTSTGAVILSRAGVANGNGIRHAASRIIEANKPTAPVDIAGGITATVTQMLEAGIFLCSASATLTLPTMQGAAGLVQALPGTPVVGDIITFRQIVAAAQTATLAVGTGSTLGGIATTAAATTGRIWVGRITSVTANAETVTWY